MLTEQKKLFVDEFIKQKCKNATQAAIKAGYSKKTAGRQASDLLKSLDIQEYLKERKNALYQDLRETFMFECQEAVDVMREILTNPQAQDRDRLSAARDFLDRAGFKPSDEIKLSGRVDMNNPYEGLTTEQLIKLAGDCD